MADKFNNSSGDLNQMELFSHSAMLAVFLALFSVITIIGNTLVILAVILRPNLHTPTGYMILSLAGADLIVGVLVMPFNIVFEMADHTWLFGLTFCDVWHSLDVLASTASIWNLCVIALDRYLAVVDPLKYPERMTKSKAVLALSIVWIGSGLIAFPAIAWWRSASPDLYTDQRICAFTDDLGYLTFSSTLSFYLPLLITIVAYWKIYSIASRFQKGLLTGHKSLPSNPNIQMRIHRGGSAASHNNHSEKPSRAERPSSLISKTESLSVIRNEGANVDSPFLGGANSAPKAYWRSINAGNTIQGQGQNGAINRRPKQNILQRLLAKESKAAKTLGVVVTCFVACWLPFFVVNVIIGACATCVVADRRSLKLIFSIVTWLGHCNSALNPFIYTFFNREFRHAFLWLLCCQRRRRQKYSTRRGLAKAIEGSLKVVVPQVSSTTAGERYSNIE